MSKYSISRMLIIVLLLASWALVQGPLMAQSLWLGARGGLSIPDLRGGNSEQTQGYSSRLGPDFGAFLRKEISTSFAVQIELLYASQGGKKDGMQLIPDGSLPDGTVPPGTALYANYQNETIMNYLEVPVLARYTFNFADGRGPIKLYVEGGPYIGFLLNAKTETSGISSIYIDKLGTPLALPPLGTLLPPVDFTASTPVTSDIKTINAGITGGLGVSTSLGPGSVILDARATYGLTDVQRDPTNGKNNTGSFVIAIGYEIPI